MTPSKNLTARPVTLPRRALTSAEFSQLEDVPPETEWFANIDNPHTRRAYRNDLKEFMTFTGIRTPVELRLITRAHVIAWRKDLDRRKLAPGSVRRKLSALSSLYEFLTDQNAVPTNPVKGVKRPKVDSYEGKTPAIADKEARQLMSLPSDKSLKGLRDRALLATLLYHTACGVKNSVASRSRTSTPGAASRTCACTAKATRPATSPCTPARKNY